MSEYTCSFCYSDMELQSGPGYVDIWECPCCHAKRSYGWERLPDPDLLRERSEDLAQLADEIEKSELARRIEA